MIGFLLGVPGKLKTLLDRITNSTVPLNDARVGYLDLINSRLTVNVNTLAPASTALSSSVWTGTKAGYLDAPISGVLALNYVGYVNVTVSLDSYGKGSATASIGSRDSTKTILICNGAAQSGYNIGGACSAIAYQSNYNEVTVYANASAGVGAVNVTVYVVEFA